MAVSSPIPDVAPVITVVVMGISFKYIKKHWFTNIVSRDAGEIALQQPLLQKTHIQAMCDTLL
jgi:hypothetical protein